MRVTTVDFGPVAKTNPLRPRRFERISVRLLPALLAVAGSAGPLSGVAVAEPSATLNSTTAVASSTVSAAKVAVAKPVAQGRTVIVAAGAGGSDGATLDTLKVRLQTADPKTTVVVFTGNYSKKAGMPSKNSDKREAVEEDVRRHTDVVKDFVKQGGQVFFLVGHRDYTDRGRKHVRRLRKFVNKELRSVMGDDEDSDDKVDVMPSAACGEPTVIELGDIGVLALINTQWWLRNWKADSRTNEGCAFKARSQLTKAFELVAKKYRTRRVLIAQHHPVESLGKYGGHFRLVEHLKPPIFGSLAVWGRQGGLIPQYRNHARYDSLASVQYAVAEKYGSFIFLSGHDRSLQLLRPGNQYQVVVGASGDKTGAVTAAGGDEFAESMAGWAEVQLDPTGEGRVALFDGESAKELFSSSLPPMPELHEGSLEPAPPITEDEIKSLYSKRNPGKTNLLEAVLLGSHYRNAYTLAMTFPVLNLSTELGGLSPIKVGGGNQTNSLRLQDTSGGQWALRSTSKDSSRYLPYPANKVTFINYLLEDGFTATHPAAALAVVPMATALGIYHSKPRLMYLPDQKGLGEFRGYITDELVLLERRPKAPKTGILPANLGGGASEFAPTKYKSTEQMLDKIADKPWKHQADQEMMLRARLFDIFLGDWDRHRDQWRFARLTQADGTKLYKPIPRDRDQAFAHYDGALLFLGRMVSPNIRVLRPFEDEIGSLDWLTYNARFIDAQLLNQLPRERWMEIAAEVQATLTDEVIAAGLATWSDDARELDGTTIETKLRGRRDQLVDVAARFYAKVNEQAEVLGSEHSDLIDLHFVGEEQVKLEIRRRKKGADSKPFYSRTFSGEHTDSLSIFGLAGGDHLVVHGEPNNAIEIRFLGGEGDDKVAAAEKGEDPLSVPCLAVYDRKKGTKIKKSIEVDDQRSNSTYRNHYDRYDFHHEPLKFGGLPSFLINPDDGVYLGGSVQLTLPGFKRRPYASKHSLRAFFATSTLGVEAGYKGHFPESVGDIDQVLEISGTTPTFTRNFFGFTNTYVPLGAQGRQFYQLRHSQVELQYGLLRSYLSDSLKIGVNGIGRYIDVEDTAGRFVVQSTDVMANSLDSRVFAGAVIHATISSIDSPMYPKRGIAIQATANVLSDVTPSVDNQIGNSATFTGAVVTHIPFDRGERLILSTRARVAGIIGDYPFYLAPTLGASDLRAYNAEQLAGNAVFVHSTDLRLEVLRFKTGLPSAVGVSGGIDHGLAFGSKAAGGTYHAMAGGSVFWNILGAVGVGVGYYRGFNNGSRFTLSVGPLFGATGFTQ